MTFIAPPSVNDPSLLETKPYKTYELTSETSWQMMLKNLPKIGKTDGKDVYYTYFVKEIDIPNYESTYENNDGLTAGTITIKNTDTRQPGYELPHTGGFGVYVFYVSGVFLLVGASILSILKRYNISKKRRCI